MKTLRRCLLLALLPLLASCATTPGRNLPLASPMAMAFCEDDRTMVVSTVASEIALFDVSPLRFRRLLAGRSELFRPLFGDSFRSPPVACSAKARLALAAGVAGDIVGWDTDSGLVWFRARAEEKLAGVAFLPDGKSFVTAGPTATHWSIGDGGAIGAFETPGNASATSIAVSPDGSVVLVGLSTGEIAEFDATTREPLRVLKGHHAPVTGIAFAPDGSAFASTAGRFDPRVWNRTETPPVPQTLAEIAKSREALGKAEGGSVAAVWLLWIAGVIGGPYGVPPVYVPPATSSVPFAATATSSWCSPSIAYSPDGRFIAVIAEVPLLAGKFHVVLTDLVGKTGRVIYGVYGCSVAFSRDSKIVATGGFGAPQLWDVETGMRVERER